MKTSVLIVVSLLTASCEMDDAYFSDFLNDMTINVGDDDGPAEPVCGDGQLDPNESCDDGNIWWGDGCSEYCWVEPGWVCPWEGEPCYYEGYYGYCGDGIIQPETGEQCDDGNYWDGDGCSSWCTFENQGCYWDDGSWYAPGDVIWPEETYYCECTIYNWFECYVTADGCYDDYGYYHEAGETFVQPDGMSCECFGNGDYACSMVDPI